MVTKKWVKALIWSAWWARCSEALPQVLQAAIWLLGHQLLQDGILWGQDPGRACECDGRAVYGQCGGPVTLCVRQFWQTAGCKEVSCRGV